MKRLIIQCDGLGDKEYDQLEGKTPLEFAKTPYIDSIIDKSKLGMVNTIPEGCICNSYYGNLELLGFDFSKPHMKFAPFIAKLNFDNYDYNDKRYVIICKLVSIKDNLIYPIEDISSKDLQELVISFNKLKCAEKYNLDFKIYHNTKLMLFINKENIDINFKDASNLEEKEIADLIPNGNDKEILIDTYRELYNMLINHPINKNRIQEKKLPINSLVFSEGGYGQDFESFKEWSGIDGTLIAGSKFLRTLGNLINMKVICPRGATGGLDTDLKEKVKATIEEIKHGNDIVFLHINLTDEVSHKGDLEGKIRVIEKIDKEVVGTIIGELLNSIDNFKLMIVTDHYTCCSTKSHEKGEVPFLIWDGMHHQNHKKHFCERNCKNEKLYFDSGKDLFNYFI